MNNSEKVYTKRVVARYSPKNGCNAPEGSVLIVQPKGKVPMKTVVQHVFVNAVGGEKSKYGWIAETTPFGLNHFISDFVGEGVSDSHIEHIRIMLESIQSLPVGTPVTADYKLRGVIEKRMDFTVHKVVFY